MTRFIIIITFLLLNSISAYAGGSDFQIKVHSFAKTSDSKYILSFTPLTSPYGDYLDDYISNSINMTLIIEFDCNQSFFTCLFSKRTFTKEQHQEAINQLIEIAKPDTIITLGVMSSGFVPLKEHKATFKSFGLFLSNGTVFTYENSHL